MATATEFATKIMEKFGEYIIIQLILMITYKCGNFNTESRKCYLEIYRTHWPTNFILIFCLVWKDNRLPLIDCCCSIYQGSSADLKIVVNVKSDTKDLSMPSFANNAQFFVGERFHYKNSKVIEKLHDLSRG